MLRPVFRLFDRAIQGDGDDDPVQHDAYRAAYPQVAKMLVEAPEDRDLILGILQVRQAYERFAAGRIAALAAIVQMIAVVVAVVAIVAE